MVAQGSTFALNLLAMIPTIHTATAKKMDKKIEKFEKKMDLQPEWKKKASGSGGGGGDWKWPFFILFVMIVGISCAMFYYFQKLLRKTHLP